MSWTQAMKDRYNYKRYKRAGGKYGFGMWQHIYSNMPIPQPQLKSRKSTILLGVIG